MTCIQDVSGTLVSEDIALSEIGEMQDYWYRPSITDSSQRRVDLDGGSIENLIVQKPVANGRDLLYAALRSQNVDFMIRDQSRPQPPADSGWVSR